MSQQDNFSGGFLLGAVFGGIAGGVLGAILANRTMEAEVETEVADSDRPDRSDHPNLSDSKSTGKRSLRISQEDDFEGRAELARISLEDKIAQLNEALDDVRDQLKRVDAPAQMRSMVETGDSDGV